MRPLLSLLVLSGLVAALASAPRWLFDLRRLGPQEARWEATDPDTLYHVRRVDRLLADGPPVAGVDAYLNHPEGAAIPWPPYYTLLVGGALAPFAPDEPEARRAFLERWVASLPMVFGVLTALLAALAGALLAGGGGAGRAAGAFAGAYYSLCVGAIGYGQLGNGDHHAFVSLLAAVVFLGFSAALASGRLERPRAAAGAGAALGALLGFAIGAWVAALVYLVLVQLALGWLLLGRGRRRLAGLPHFGLALHLAALAVLAPAVLQSPWRELRPWIVVNLSWFHPAFLALGALVFVPPLFLGGRPRTHARYPWLAALALALLGAALAALDAGPARGVREGFAWVSRADRFMAGIAESRPLLGPGAEPGELLRFLGWAAPLAPLAWAWAAWRALARGEDRLLPFVVALPFLALQAARQARFADALAMPLAALLGWALARAAVALSARAPRLAHLPASLGVAAALALGLALQGESVAHAARLVRLEPGRVASPELHRARAARGMYEWLRAETPAPPDYAVLAVWNRGHALEWCADRPSVATNFGSYVGEEGFLAPPRFLLSEDPAAAERLLEQRGARYVLATALLPASLPQLHGALPELVERYYVMGSESSGALRPRWFRTVGARLLFDGHVHPRGGAPAPDLGFLRLVHVSPVVLARSPLAAWRETVPFGWVWERVRGARIEGHAAPGTRLSAELELAYPPRGERLRFRTEATADADGVARVRVPYSTREPNGDGLALGRLRWKLGEREGELDVDAASVLAGRTLRLP